MKTLVLLFLLLSLPGYSQSNFTIEPYKYTIFWKGTHSLGNGHDGIASIKSGSLSVTSDGKISKGQFVIDMKSIKTRATDSDDDDLIKHLKSADFFATDRYPEASIAMFGFTPLNSSHPPDSAMIKAILTIKGISDTVTFPVTFNTDGTRGHLKGTLFFDRTLWNITFDAKKDFMASLKDGFIASEIEIYFDINLLRAN